MTQLQQKVGGSEPGSRGSQDNLWVGSGRDRLGRNVTRTTELTLFDLAPAECRHGGLDQAGRLRRGRRVEFAVDDILDTPAFVSCPDKGIYPFVGQDRSASKQAER